jgi:hypothetical protein
LKAALITWICRSRGWKVGGKIKENKRKRKRKGIRRKEKGKGREKCPKLKPLRISNKLNSQRGKFVR